MKISHRDEAERNGGFNIEFRVNAEECKTPKRLRSYRGRVPSLVRALCGLTASSLGPRSDLCRDDIGMVSDIYKV